ATGPGLGEGSLVIDMSTTQPLVSKKIAGAFAERGVAFVDAPVSGGPAGAQAGTLSIMAGGEASAYARAEPVLSHVGGSVVHVGGPGSGGIAKLVNNMIVGAAFTSVAEGFALASAHDIEISTLHQAIRGGWAGSKVLDLSAEAVSKGDFSPAGTVDLLSKDLGYARDLARSGNIPVPVTAIVDEVFTAAKARGTGGNAQPVIVELWEKLMNSEIAANAAERGTVDKSR
ncbi:MAG: NAD(P)-dependent oxidoreductase, partial [Spirochaetia bacterium]